MRDGSPQVGSISALPLLGVNLGLRVCQKLKCASLSNYCLNF